MIVAQALLDWFVFTGGQYVNGRTGKWFED